MKKIVAFANGALGLKILHYLIAYKEIEVVAIILNSESKSSINYETAVYETIRAKETKPQIFRYSESLWDDSDFLKIISNSSHGVSSLFGHIIPKRIIESFEKGIMNLHPSLLPIGRGADPIPWAIIEKRDQGVTIHLISEGIDAGPVLIQKKLSTNISMSAGQIYSIAMDELLNLFEKVFPEWIFGELTNIEQQNNGTFHKSSDLAAYKTDIENISGSFEQVIRVIQALTYDDGRVPNFVDSDGIKWRVSLSLEAVKRVNE